MRFRNRTAVGLATALTALTMILATAESVAAYEFPSSNGANRDAGLPHVDVVSTAPGMVTLQFVNETNSLAFFEYRIDGIEVGTTAHPIVQGDVIHPGVSVDGRPASVTGPVIRPFAATATVEIRLALGGERDWDFDWTEFAVGSATTNPTTKDDCTKGGWATFGFSNQGQCTTFVNTGKDSR